MKEKAQPLFAVFSFLIFTALSISLVSAAFTVSVSTPSKSLVENNQVSVTVTVTNPGTSSESNVVVQLAGSPTQWFGSPLVQDCSVISSIAASQSQTSTCILRPTAVGTDLTLTATAESSGGTTGSGNTGGISVSSQSGSLTASVSAPSSAALSSTLYASVSVTAPSTADATNVRTTASLSGACSLVTTTVPSSQTLGTVSKGTTKSSLSWEVLGSSSAGTCTVTVNVESDSAGSASPSKSVTVGTVSSSTSTSTSSAGGASSGGGGGGGAGAAATAKVSESKKEATVKISSIAANSESTIFVSSPEISITELKIRVGNAVENVEVTFKKLDEKPSEVALDAPGIVNQYIRIDKVNISDSDIREARIEFKVENSWLLANNIDENMVSLYRYADGQWSQLPTEKVSEDGTNVHYEATSPGLSLFAVSGEVRREAPQEPSEAAGEDVSRVIGGFLKENWWILAVIFAVIAGGIVFSLKKGRRHLHRA